MSCKQKYFFVAGLVRTTLNAHTQAGSPHQRGDSLCNLVNMEWRHSQTTNIDKIDKLQVYPNPTEGEITFDFELATQQQGELLLYNLQGQEVFKYKIPTETDKFTVNLSSLVSGMYMYKITGNESFTGKIIIE